MCDVVNLKPRNDNQPTPHNTGAARCIQCKHEWVAVAPVGVIEFECPSCGLMKGAFHWLTRPPNAKTWVCNCGNDLFGLFDSGPPMCSLCGLRATGWAES